MEGVGGWGMGDGGGTIGENVIESGVLEHSRVKNKNLLYVQECTGTAELITFSFIHCTPEILEV